MWKKNEGYDNLKANISKTDYDRSKTAGNLEYFNYLCGIMLEKDGDQLIM
jgi:hypothetical protein